MLRQKPHTLLEISQLAMAGLHIDSFQVLSQEAWVVIGSNNSGMNDFVSLLSHKDDQSNADGVKLHEKLTFVSFAGQQELFEKELKEDDSDFLNYPDPGTLTRDFLGQTEAHKDLIALFNLSHVLDRGLRHLSSGEARKTSILKHLISGTRFLALEHPFDGLDLASCQELQALLNKLHKEKGLTLLLFISDISDVPNWVTHMALIEDNAMVLSGPLAAILPSIKTRQQEEEPMFQAVVSDLHREKTSYEDAETPLIELHNGFARYGEVPVFNGLDLTIHQGEHTLVTGPNGCGKSTFIQLMTGDHPLCYTNDLRIFGKRRGSGESIWEIKRHMGIVSNDLHRNHRVSGSALSIVLSGLYDSIGLYCNPNPEERKRGEYWLGRLGLASQRNRSFRKLSYGEQRLVLLGRALIKAPQLLLLDEPTQGLDAANRMALLNFLEKAAEENICTIIYISHRPDECRPFFKQHLHFDKTETSSPFRLTLSGVSG